MGRRSHRRQPAAGLNEDLVTLMTELGQFAGTDRGARAFERLAPILTRPGMRVARDVLEDLLPDSEADPNDITDVVNAALFQFYQSIGSYKAGRSPIAWFSGMVRERAKELARRKYRTHAEPHDLMPLQERAFLVVAPGDGPDELTAEQVSKRLTPPVRELLVMVTEGHTLVEIAMRIHKPVWYVRKEIRKLRTELGALQPE